MLRVWFARRGWLRLPPGTTFTWFGHSFTIVKKSGRSYFATLNGSNAIYWMLLSQMSNIKLPPRLTRFERRVQEYIKQEQPHG